ncbi:MAG: hypothetical protein ACYS0E_00720 [Planctomycetota bacterium]|jgi:hypothetical protein
MIRSLPVALLLVSSFAFAGEKIAWYGTLESARAEAKRTNRPILLTSARPECRDVPGFW